MDRPLYGKRVREMSNSMCNMRALHRRLERAGPRRLTFPFARFRRIGSCRASYAIRVGAAACTSSHTWAYSTFAGGQPWGLMRSRAEHYLMALRARGHAQSARA